MGEEHHLPVEGSSRGAVLRVHVQPGARGEGFAGWHGEALKVRVRAPASDGRANTALMALLAAQLGVASSSLSLVSGETSRDKRVLFARVDAVELKRRLALHGDLRG
ncbi:MAG TPA: DUF167 family protein [Acidimicrobiales bacterium]|nr:DUF167 family protein [Acidimicrobiales bacterium]